MRARWVLAVLLFALTATVVGGSAEMEEDAPSAGALHLEDIRAHAGRFPFDAQQADYTLPEGFTPVQFSTAMEDQAAFWIEGGTYARAWIGDQEAPGGSFAFYGIEVVPPEHHRLDEASHLWVMGFVASDTRVADLLFQLGLPGVAVGGYSLNDADPAALALIEGRTDQGAMPFRLTTTRSEAVDGASLQRWFLQNNTARPSAYLDISTSKVWSLDGVADVDAAGRTTAQPGPAGAGGWSTGASTSFVQRPLFDARLQIHDTLYGEIHFVCEPAGPSGGDAMCFQVYDYGDDPSFFIPEAVERITVEVLFARSSIMRDLEVCVVSPFEDSICETVTQEPSGTTASPVDHIFVIQDPALVGQVGAWSLEFSADEPQRGFFTAVVSIEPRTTSDGTLGGFLGWLLGPDGTWPFFIAPASVVAVVSATVRALKRYRPVEFFAFLFLFTRIKRDEALENQRRAALLEYIIEEPGCSFSDLRRTLDVGSGSLAHHLKILQQQEYIKSVRDGIRTRFYVRGPAIPHDVYLTATQASVLEAVRNNPGVTQKDLAALVGLPRQNVAYHIGRLLEMHKIDCRSDGALRRHYPT